MKINDLIGEFRIQMSNEEKLLLDRMSKPCYFNNLTEREQFVAENLIRKSLISKVKHNGAVVIIQNENY
jgi:hypothetical protein|tara:strand:+ start:96 stop:302 length:207 start_codon:yes stop_codon:yes gene_type:complete